MGRKKSKNHLAASLSGAWLLTWMLPYPRISPTEDVEGSSNNNDTTYMCTLLVLKKYIIFKPPQVVPYSEVASPYPNFSVEHGTEVYVRFT